MVNGIGLNADMMADGHVLSEVMRSGNLLSAGCPGFTGTGRSYWLDISADLESVAAVLIYIFLK